MALAQEDPSDLDIMFSRGIDPDVEQPDKCHSHPEAPPAWPPKHDIISYVQQVLAPALLRRVMQDWGHRMTEAACLRRVCAATCHALHISSAPGPFADWLPALLATWAVTLLAQMQLCPSCLLLAAVQCVQPAQQSAGTVARC